MFFLNLGAKSISKVDNLQQNTISYSFSNLCGGAHTYEIFANSQNEEIDLTLNVLYLY